MSAEPFQLFSPLDSATEAALRFSIERFGVLVPVVKDQHGRVIDGYHRSRIASELGVPFRIDVVPVEDDDQARDIARTLNTDRRHLSVEQRREVEVGMREAGHSLRAIGAALGVSEGTVRNDLSTAQDYAVPERVVGRDGKSRPSRRLTVVSAKNEREAERAQTALADTELPEVPVVDVKRVERLAREQDAERRRNEPIESVTAEDDITVLHGDFREVLTAEHLDGAIVITDPPYPREFLDEWSDFATRAFTSGSAALVAMCGQSFLPEVMARVEAAGWVYRWTSAYLTIGPATRVWNANVGSSWKPILVFDRGQEREFVTTDVFRSTGDDKQHHHWGQNENGIAQLLEAFTQPGELVVDPFLGGGTTAVVCRALGRRFVGCDIDAAAVSTTRERLAA